MLRSKGISFGRIAKELGLSINTVKSFCRRNQPGEIVVVQPTQEISVSILCRQCGKRLNRLPGHRPRKFCSEVCKRTWWTAHPEHSQKKAWHNADCNYCGIQRLEPFLAVDDMLVDTETDRKAAYLLQKGTVSIYLKKL